MKVSSYSLKITDRNGKQRSIPLDPADEVTLVMETIFVKKIFPIEKEDK